MFSNTRILIMDRFKILALIPHIGYPVALDAIEALKELDQLVIAIDLRKVRKEVLSQTIKIVIEKFKPDFILTISPVGECSLSPLRSQFKNS
ncbi:TPA: hypothetical protein DCX15_05485 [bacterium]|nr:hypothetical protein [bacterium]